MYCQAKWVTRFPRWITPPPYESSSSLYPSPSSASSRVTSRRVLACVYVWKNVYAGQRVRASSINENQKGQTFWNKKQKKIWRRFYVIISNRKRNFPRFVCLSAPPFLITLYQNRFLDYVYMVWHFLCFLGLLFVCFCLFWLSLVSCNVKSSTPRRRKKVRVT
jgi:hypothetical protein